MAGPKVPRRCGAHTGNVASHDRGRYGRFGPAFDPLLEAAQAGAAWAFARLFEGYGAAVAGYLRAQGVADPDGLANDVFLRVFRSVGAFSGPEEKFRSWLFTIAHNLVVDEHRRTARRPALAGEDIAGFPSAHPTGDGEDDAMARLADASVHELLTTLVPDQRDVLLLRIVADLTAEEVAAALGKSVGAVKQLQRRGLESLRRKISLGEAVPL
jgi:RNA polymerase sigma factor (sigma-70 family)